MTRTPYMYIPDPEEHERFKGRAVRILDDFMQTDTDVQSALRILEIAVAATLDILRRANHESVTTGLAYADSFNINVRANMLAISQNPTISSSLN